MFLTALALLAAQAGAAPTGEQARLTLCLEQARSDPASAISTAGAWLSEASGAGQAFPQQCLGQAYVSLLRWDAAEQAFLAGRAVAVDGETRARLGAMAGNAALAAGDNDTAARALAAAESDAMAAGDTELGGTIAADRARALVAIGDETGANEALDRARTSASQDAEVWLLSATLKRREKDLDSAGGFIATALALAPGDPQVLLEAGVIAILRDDEAAARGYWQKVQAAAPGSPEAATATGYIDQLDGHAPVKQR